MSDFLAGIFAAVMGLLPGGAADEAEYVGYLEADYVYVAPMGGGRIGDVAVREGEPVAAGDILFTQDAAQQQALLTAARARVEAAQANLDNLTTGSRALEIAVIRASLDKAQSDLVLAQSNLTRSEKLLLTGTVTEARVEQDRAALAAAQAQVAQLTAQVGVAELPARNAQQVAAEADLGAAEADASRAQLDLADRQTEAPVAGTVDRLFYSAGEMATAGTPVGVDPARRGAQGALLCAGDRPIGAGRWRHGAGGMRRLRGHDGAYHLFCQRAADHAAGDLFA
jgi:HlyD family secretion protein